MVSKKVLIKQFVEDLRLMVGMLNSGNLDDKLRKGIRDNIYFEIYTMYSIGLISLDKEFYLEKIIFRK